MGNGEVSGIRNECEDRDKPARVGQGLNNGGIVASLATSVTGGRSRGSMLTVFGAASRMLAGNTWQHRKGESDSNREHAENCEWFANSQHL